MTDSASAQLPEPVAQPADVKGVANVRAVDSEVLAIPSDRAELLRRFAAMPRATQDASIQIAEMNKAMQALRQARDGILARASDLAEKLRAANDKIDELTDSCELATLERDGALERLHTAHAELRAMSESIETANHAQDVASASSDAGARISSELLAKARALVAAAEAREGQAKDRQKATVANLIEQFGEERRKLKAEFEELKTNSSVQIAALQAQLAAHAKDSLSAAEAERNRLEVANLKVELDSVREELRQAKLSEAESRVQQTPESVIASEPVPARGEGASTGSDQVKPEFKAMDWFLGQIEKDCSNLEALDVLVSLFRDSSERSLSAGCMAVYRVATACGDVAAWLRKTPAKLSTGIALLREGRAVLERLIESNAASSLPDPGGSKVYAVDNDGDNCECIVMALEKAAFQTRYAMKPDIAFTDLAKGPVDLIILDVDLGETDGFDLHDLIRQIDYHRETPVIFVSGLLSTAGRLAGLSGPPASFVAKPYNLNELVLKALCTILTSRLDRLARV
jgi:CheY-like chemotaxis protein